MKFKDKIYPKNFKFLSQYILLLSLVSLMFIKSKLDKRHLCGHKNKNKKIIKGMKNLEINCICLMPLHYGYAST